MKKAGKIFTIVIIALVIIGLTLPLLNVFAQENLQGPLKEVESTVGQLVELKDNTEISEKEKEEQEIKIRREALDKILSLSILEIQNLQDKIDSLKLNSEDQLAVKEGFLTILGRNLKYSKELQEANKDEKLSLDGIKNLAQQYKDWREENYNQYIKKITVFILTFQEKDVLKTANTRLDKIISDLNKLESAKLLKKEDTFNDINSALKSLTNAQIFNNEAENIIINAIKKEILEVASSTPIIAETATSTESLLISDAIATSTSQEKIEKISEVGSSTPELATSTPIMVATSTPIMATSTPKIITAEEQAQDLIEKSLREIKNAYTSFLAISSKVRLKLGLN